MIADGGFSEANKSMGVGWLVAGPVSYVSFFIFNFCFLFYLNKQKFFFSNILHKIRFIKFIKLKKGLAINWICRFGRVINWNFVKGNNKLKLWNIYESQRLVFYQNIDIKYIKGRQKCFSNQYVLENLKCDLKRKWKQVKQYSR